MLGHLLARCGVPPHHPLHRDGGAGAGGGLGMICVDCGFGSIFSITFLGFRVLGCLGGREEALSSCWGSVPNIV